MEGDRNFSGWVRIVLLLVAGTFSSAYLSAHEPDPHHNHIHRKKQAGIETGGSVALVYHPGEKTFSPGFHFHINKSMTDHFSVGLGYEAIPADEFHHTLTLFGSYAPTSFLTVLAGPGINLPDPVHAGCRLSGHIELTTSFSVGKIHFGPFAGAGFSKDDSHLSLGLHFGWHF